MLQRIKNDWNNYKIGILLAVAYLFVSTVFLGEACPTMLLFHASCPGCGLTRACFYLLTFRWQKAWQRNPMIFPLAFFLAWCFYFRYVRGKHVPFFNVGIAMLCISCVIVFLVK